MIDLVYTYVVKRGACLLNAWSTVFVLQCPVFFETKCVKLNFAVDNIFVIFVMSLRQAFYA